jgi:hypothetical protein
MNPNIWGNYIWYLLHIIVQHPDTSNDKYKQFLYILQYLLPCPKCRNNYKMHILNRVIPSNNDELTEWLFDIHNRINKDIKKPLQKYSIITNFWEKEYIKIKDIEASNLFIIMEFILYDHPGFYKIDADYAKSSILFWNIIPDLLPDKLNGLSKLKQFIKNNKLNIDIVSHKTQYYNWFVKLRRYLNIRKSIDIKRIEKLKC